MNEILQLLKTEAPYRRLLLASLISGLGDSFSNVAILSLLLHFTGTGLAIGITLAFRTIPYLVMGPIGGYLADRISKKTILILSDLARCVIALSLLLVTSMSQVWIVYVATVGLVIFSALFSPARKVMIAELVRPQNVMVANSVEQSLSGLVMAVGSLLGGLITAAFGTDIAFLFNAASFLISGLVCLSIRVPRLETPSNKEPSTPNPSEDSSLDLPQTTSFWTILRESRFIQIVTLQAFLWPIGGGAVNVLLSVYGYQEFHKGNFGVGILYGSLGVGFLLSGFIAHRFGKWIRLALIIGALLEGVAQVLVSQSPNLWVASVLLILSTLGAGVANASHDSLVMKIVPLEVQGRMFALFGTASNVMIAASMLGAGVLLNYVSARSVGFIAGMIIICSALTGFGFWRIKLPSMVAEEMKTSIVE